MGPSSILLVLRSILIVCLILPSSAAACTIVFVATGQFVFAGENEDANNPNAKMWFLPAADDQYGRVCFGFDKEFKIAESGMNDQGLFIDVNALGSDTGWESSPEKPDWEEWEGWFGTGVPDGILAKCATVEEAVGIFERYNLLTFARVKYLIGDKTGDSAVLEWSQKGLRVVRRTGDYQISTNFVTSDLKREEYSCQRYEIADRILGESKAPASVDLVNLVLSATCFEYFAFTPTVYSVVFDLKRCRVHVSFFHNFQDILTLELHEELRKGAGRHRLHDLFTTRSFAYGMFLEKSEHLLDR